MFKKLALSLTVLSIVGCQQNPGAVTSSDSTTRGVIYGEDGRTEIFDLQDSTLAQHARATVAFIDDKDLIANADGNFQVKGPKYGKSMGLCKQERFYNQIASSFCTGFLIAPNLVMSAGHCVQGHECEGAKFVFDYIAQADGTVAPIPADKIYSCVKVLSQQIPNDTSKLDYSIFQLDRNVTDREPLKLRLSGDAQVGDKLVLMGYPNGLPLKVTLGGAVRSSVANEPFFLATTDSYSGNSGSPVLNESTGEVEGILVNGDSDFDFHLRGFCQTSKVCKDGECKGEGVTKISAVLPLVAEILAAPTPAPALAQTNVE